MSLPGERTGEPTGELTGEPAPVARRDSRRVEPVMGTMVTIDVRAGDPGRVVPAVEGAVAWLHRVDAHLSTYRPDSAISRLWRGELVVADGPPELAEALTLARACERRTGGAFALAWRGGGRPDPTGVVKGWAAEHASRLLAGAGLADHCVNAAGDVRLRGRPGPGRPWAVGIDHPHRRGQLLAVVEGTELAVATSGTAQQGAHIIDPRTGRPATALASATVVGPDLGLADGFATAAVSRGWDALELLEGLDRDGWASLVVGTDGRVWSSPGFSGEVWADGIAAEAA